MVFFRSNIFIVVLLRLLSSTILFMPSSSQTLSPTNLLAARSLDALLQVYAFRAFNKPRTGIPYPSSPPSNLSGINLAVVRLRTGSLRFRGYQSYNEFQIPTGIIIKPYVERLALVYQNLGNYSSFYYNVPGYTLVSSVLGLLAYDATNLSAKNLPELDLEPSLEPISINFSAVNRPPGVAAWCVVFNLDGSIKMNDLSSDNLCKTYTQGHFSIVVNSSEISPAPAPAPALAPVPSLSFPRSKRNMSEVWKIVGSAVGGFLFLVVFLLLVLYIVRCRNKRKVKRMTRVAEAGEILQKRRVGGTQLPTASMSRTKPALEDEQAP